MRKICLTTLAVFIGLSITSCNSPERKAAPLQAGQPGAQREIGGSPAWKLLLTAKCDGDQSRCIGAYGFTILANGSFQVGPGPAGQILSGKLTDEEFQTIENALETILKPSFPIDIPEAAGQEICAANTAVSGKESIIFNRRGQDIQIVHASGSEFCFREMTMVQADTLHKILRTLAATYYLLPFPDACADTTNELQALFPSVSNCVVDSDCAFADTSFMPVGPTEMQFIVTDDCSNSGALAVANRNALLYRQDELLHARAHARDVCGVRYTRTDCSQITGFQSTTAAPACLQGSCKVNASVQ